MTNNRSSGPTRGERQVLWFFGADAVGKSVVGWEAYSQLRAAGVPAAYIDLDHLGFCDPRPDDLVEMVATNLGTMWANFTDHGIRCLVVSGVVVTAEDRRRFGAHVDPAHLQLVLLRARPGTIKERIVRRRQVEAQQQESSLGADVLQDLDEYAARSAHFAELLDRAGTADLVMDTDASPPATIAGQALSRAGLL